MAKKLKKVKIAAGACAVEVLFIAQHEAGHRVLLRVCICLEYLAILVKYVIISSSHHFQNADVVEQFLEFCEINSLNGMISGPGKINWDN